MDMLTTNTKANFLSSVFFSTLLAAFASLCYWPSLRYLFVYDDYGYIISNFKLSHGLTLATLKWAFTTFEQSNWHPLTWLAYLLEFSFFGLDPFGYHIINIILHTANVILFFFVLKTLTGFTVRSFFASLIFCVHPAHIESVVWISELKDVLSCFFWMISMLFYIAYSREKKFWSYLGAFFAMVLGLMAKPMLVTLPCIFLLLDAWPLGRLRVFQANNSSLWTVCRRLFRPSASTLYRLLLEKIPFFLLTIASSLMTYLAQRKGGSVAPLDWLPLWKRSLNAITSYVMYLLHFIWPSSLAFHYPYPAQLPILKVLGCVILLSCISVAAIKLRKKAPYFLFGWLWYLGTLVPVIGILQVGAQAMADRYLYIPSAGLCLIVVWGFSDLTQRLQHGRLVLTSLGCSAIFILMMTHVTNLKYWSDEITLYTHGVEITGPHYIAMHNLGYVYLLLGELDKAQYYLKAALKFSPESFKVHSNLGQLYTDKNDLVSAEKEFSIASQLNPTNPNPYINLANIAIKQNDNTKALNLLNKALQLDPYSPIALGNIGFIYFNDGDISKAKEYYEKALVQYPRYLTAIYRLGLLELKQNNWTKALKYFDKYLDMDPTSFEVWNSKGTAYIGLKQYKQAQEAFEQALQIKSDYSIASDNLTSLEHIMQKAQNN